MSALTPSEGQPKKFGVSNCKISRFNGWFEGRISNGLTWPVGYIHLKVSLYDRTAPRGDPSREPVEVKHVNIDGAFAPQEPQSFRQRLSFGASAISNFFPDEYDLKVEVAEAYSVKPLRKH